MKQGIHLGPPIRRAPFLRFALWFLLGVSALNVVDTWRARREVARLRAALDEPSLTTVASGLSAESLAALDRIRALEISGALDSHAPTVLLSLVEGVVPRGLRVTSLTLRPGAPGSLLVEATAQSESDLTAFQKALAAAPLVAETRLLEERRAPGPGRVLAVRLEASLVAP